MNLVDAPELVTAAVAVAVVVLVIRFQIICLEDIAQAEEWEVRYFSKQVWTFIIFFWIPLGGILYMMVGRER